MTLNPISGPTGLTTFRQNTSSPSGAFTNAKRHSAEQIAQALRQAEAGTPIGDTIRKLGARENTFICGRRDTAGWERPKSGSYGSFVKRT